MAKLADPVLQAQATGEDVGSVALVLGIQSVGDGLDTRDGGAGSDDAVGRLVCVWRVFDPPCRGHRAHTRPLLPALLLLPSLLASVRVLLFLFFLF